MPTSPEGDWYEEPPLLPTRPGPPPALLRPVAEVLHEHRSETTTRRIALALGISPRRASDVLRAWPSWFTGRRRGHHTYWRLTPRARAFLDAASPE